ncbi:MAG: cytochrome c [Pseudomonadota bacterium]
MKRLVVLFTLIGTVALAHAGAKGIVKERMDGMKAIGAAMKSIAPMMTGKADFDSVLAQEASGIIMGHSGQIMIDQFPEGSDGGVSEAAATIWQQPERFAEIAFQLEQLAADLPKPDMSPEDRAQLFKDIGQTCRDCHSAYRISN